MPVWEEEENYDEEEDDCEGPVEMGGENVFKKSTDKVPCEMFKFRFSSVPKNISKNDKPKSETRSRLF